MPQDGRAAQPLPAQARMVRQEVMAWGGTRVAGALPHEGCVRLGTVCRHFPPPSSGNTLPWLGCLSGREAGPPILGCGREAGSPIMGCGRRGDSDAMLQIRQRIEHNVKSKVQSDI